MLEKLKNEKYESVEGVYYLLNLHISLLTPIEGKAKGSKIKWGKEETM